MENISQRAIKRRAYRQMGKEWPAAENHHVFADGSYSVLRPTKGWAYFTAKRLLAIQETARLKGVSI